MYYFKKLLFKFFCDKKEKDGQVTCPSTSTKTPRTHYKKKKKSLSECFEFLQLKFVNLATLSKINKNYSILQNN